MTISIRGIRFASPYNERSFCLLSEHLGDTLSRELAHSVDSRVTVPRRFGGPAILAASSAVARRAHMTKVSSESMYLQKVLFDLGISRAISRAAGSDAFVGMWGASARSIARVSEMGGFSALNFVNAHPMLRNSILRSIGLPAGHHEMVPTWFLKRVDDELRLAQLIVVPSHLVRSDLVARGVPTERIAVSAYGVDLKMFMPLGGIAARNGNRLTVLYVGQISHRKGVPAILAAARRRPSVTVRLVGPVVSGGILSDLPANATHTGTVRHDNLCRLFSTADVVLLPSWEDTFGLVILEALASGTPVAVSSSAGASEVIDSRCGWVIQPGSADDIVSVIDELTDHGGATQQMREAARSCAEGYPWRRFVRDVAVAIRDRSLV